MQDSNSDQKPATKQTSGKTRREFLGNQIATTAAVATGLSLSTAGTLHSQEPSEKKTDSDGPILRYGMVGCGGRGTGASNDSMKINENINLVALADLQEDNCKRARNELKKRHPEKVSVSDSSMYTGLDAYKRILDDPEIDIVFFTTSPGFRPRHIAEAVDAGKHVFAEKPVCVDPAGYRICLKAHDKAVEQGTAIVTGTQYRRQTNYVEAIKKLREGAIGDIVSAESRYCSTGIWNRTRKEGMSDLEYQLFNWMHFIWLSGDQIAEQAVHNIDAINWVMDSPPEKAFASGGRFSRPEDSQMWDAVSVDYQYPGNRTVSFKCRQWPGAKSDNGNIIYGTEAIMKIGAMSSGTSIFDRKGNKIWSAEGSISDAYKQEHKDLVDSIIAGKPIVELKQTADSSLTAVMGRMAAYTGQEVTWDFVTKESKLDLFPKDLTADSDVPLTGHAVPGVTKLI